MRLCLVHTELQTFLVTVRVSRGLSPRAGPQTQKQVCSLGLGSGACSGWEGCEVSTCLFSSKGAALQEEVAPKRRLGDTGRALGGWGGGGIYKAKWPHREIVNKV